MVCTALFHGVSTTRSNIYLIIHPSTLWKKFLSENQTDGKNCDIQWSPHYISKLYEPFHACIIAKGPHLPHHPNISTEQLETWIHFPLEFSFSTRSPVKNVPLPSLFMTTPQSTSLNIIKYQSFHHSTSSRTSSISIATMDTSDPSSVVMTVVILPDKKTSCNYVLTTRSL